MTQASADPVFRYRAFISYSHQDKTWADWLHKALETYAIPKRLVGQTTSVGVTPKRLAPIFRDRDELASATDLGRKVNDALGQSANLVVICSPRSATSRWVNEEVLAFKRLGRSERIFCLIVDGEPNASALPGREAEECFAPALLYQLGADGELTQHLTEPIAADARPGKDGKTNAKLKLIAGVLDVGFDALKRRELQRRTRRMTAVAALAIMVMAVTTTLAITAVIARHAAERRQKQAESLVGFMLGDLGDKLQQVSRLDIMEAVDDQAMSYFKSLPTTDVTDEALVQRAKALERIGGVRLDQGHLSSAMEAFQAASGIAAALVKSDPSNAARRLAYARVLAFVGMTYWRQGELNDAQETFESARDLLERPDSHASNDPTLQFELAMVDNNIGHVLEARGRLDEANIRYRKELALCQGLVAAKPDNTDWSVQLGETHNNLGKLALMRGDLATAVAEYSADNSIETKLSDRDPKNNDQKENVVTVRAILGRTLALTGDIQRGSQDLQQATDIADQLIVIEPANADFQKDLALYSSQLSRLSRLNGDPATANKLVTQSLSAFLALIKRDPSNRSWRREYAEALTEQANQSRAGGQLEAARMQAQAADAVLSPLLIKQPNDRATLLAAAETKLLLAAMSNDRKTAQQMISTTLSQLEAVPSGKDDPRLLALQVAALLALDRTADAKPMIQKLWRTGYRDAAFVQLLQQAHIDYPVNTDFSRQLVTRMN